MTIYLGPLGALQALPLVGGDVDASVTIPTAVHDLLSGGRVIDRIGAGKRTYRFTGEYLTADELSVIESLAFYGFGVGQLLLIDPWRRNMLSANQSSGTDVTADATGFVANSGIISSSTARARQGFRSVAWAVAAAVQSMGTGTDPTFTSADPVLDIPVLPSTSYVASVYGQLLPTFTGSVRVDILWFTKAGVLILTSFGTLVALTTSGFTRVSLVGTSPSNAALCRMRVVTSALAASQTIYLDQWQLESNIAANQWVLGTGVPRVAFTELSNTHPMDGYENVSLTLVEL